MAVAQAPRHHIADEPVHALIGEHRDLGLVIKVIMLGNNGK
jgi:hypothetical protein